MAAGVAWFEVALVADLVMVVVRPAAQAGRALETVLPLVLAGFVAQTLLGSLSHLLPAIAGGGPARLKRNAALLERGWQVRLAAANLAVPLLVLPVPGPLRLLGWTLLLGSVTAFVVLALAVLLGPALTGRPAVHAIAGVLLGCVLTGAAVVVAGTTGPAATTLSGEASGTVSGPARTVEVTLVGMRIRPGTIEAPPGTRLTLRVTNRDGQRHDLRLSTGQSTPMLDHGQSATLMLDTPATAVDGWCTVVGHRAAGMSMRIVPVTPAGTATTAQATHDGQMSGHDMSASAGRLDLTAPMSPGWKPYDATLRPAPGGTEHRIEIHAREAELEVAPGVRQRMWTFNGTVPGPVLRGRVGDVFTVTFVNDAGMGHGLDFHAGALAPDRPMRTIQPGERLTYRFRADFAGAWLYHCSTMPMSQHIANGMYGAVIVDPPDLPHVDREYVLVQGELHLGEPGSRTQVDKIVQGRPDGWMFNGTAAGYDHAPLEAKAGERVRIWAVAAGPGSGTSLHVVGAPYDTVYKEGAYTLKKGGPGGAQALDLAPAQGGFVELVFPEPGTYPIVDHDMRHAEAGAHGVFRVSAP
ncbi:multicopper oxidase domain-containing protein [Microtetraspora malaysiensis]|uniref:multicopper oxidase domain-containing protein n=1 Tax=Microtetraspora malaysiensis TaxID=161358 RepID=UPI003D9175D7